jgi:hypothetical protein
LTGFRLPPEFGVELGHIDPETPGKLFPRDMTGSQNVSENVVIVGH